MEMVEATISDKEFEAICRVVKEKLRKEKKVSIRDIEPVAPENLRKHENLMLMALYDAVAEVGEEAGALFLELTEDGVKVLSREEYDEDNDHHLLLDELDYVLAQIESGEWGKKGKEKKKEEELEPWN